MIENWDETWYWYICLFIATVTFLLILTISFIRYFIARSRRTQEDNKRYRTSKKFSINSLIGWMIVATFVSAFILVLPVVWNSAIAESLESSDTGFDVFVIGIRSAMQVFSLDGEYLDLYKSVNFLPLFKTWYRAFGAILYVAAPLLVVGYIITFFQNIYAHIRLRLTRKRIYVFSDLNEESLILAESIVKHRNNKDDKTNNQQEEQQTQPDKKYDEKALIVFTDVYNQNNDEKTSDLLNRAGNDRFLRVREDILDLNINFAKKAKKPGVYLFILGPDKSENMEQAYNLIERYKNFSNINLYMIADTEEDQLFISSVLGKNSEDVKINVRFINSAQSLVYSYLYNQFKVEENKPQKDNIFNYTHNINGQEILSVLIVGFGKDGNELLRALTWCAQVREVRLEAYIFEKDPVAEQKFVSECPEIKKYNHKGAEGETPYDIYFVSGGGQKGIDAETADFDKYVQNLPYVSIAYVMMGEDDANVRIALKLRRIFRKKCANNGKIQAPKIVAVVYDPIKNVIAKEHPLRIYTDKDPDNEDTKYDIEFIGNQEEMWSKEVIMLSDLEANAREMHVVWAEYEARKKLENERQEKLDEDSIENDEKRKFYLYNYYRKSSMSKVIRENIQRIALEKGLDKDKARKLEKNGWNIYMRSEGYCYAENRDDLAKLHDRIIPYEQLKKEHPDDVQKNDYEPPKDEKNEM